ncbi:MAG: hypothetical protein AB7F43_12310 [Bacteriovoracia bacterium]
MKNKKTVTLMILLSLTSLSAFAELRAENEPRQFASNSYVNRDTTQTQSESIKSTPITADPEKIEIKRVFRHAGRGGM